jgi:hypothetical protein
LGGESPRHLRKMKAREKSQFAFLFPRMA